MEQRYEQIQRGASTVEINAMLFSAADKGCLDLAKLLLSEGASLEARDRLGAKPLARAASPARSRSLRCFSSSGAPIDARDLDGSTALFKAAEAGRLPMVELLVEHGADIDMPGRNGITPLSAAAYMGSAPIVQLLHRQGRRPQGDRRNAEVGHRLCRGHGASCRWCASFSTMASTSTPNTATTSPR